MKTDFAKTSVSRPFLYWKPGWKCLLILVERIWGKGYKRDSFTMLVNSHHPTFSVLKPYISWASSKQMKAVTVYGMPRTGPYGKGAQKGEERRRREFVCGQRGWERSAWFIFVTSTQVESCPQHVCQQASYPKYIQVYPSWLERTVINTSSVSSLWLKVTLHGCVPRSIFYLLNVQASVLCAHAILGAKQAGCRGVALPPKK